MVGITSMHIYICELEQLISFSDNLKKGRE